MPAPQNVKKGKGHLACANLSIGAFLIGGPYALSHFGLMGTLKDNVWIVQVIAYVGILIKAGISFLMTKDFRYDKFAYELTVLVMGGALTCFAVQVTSQDDIFSGLANISFLGFVSSLPVSIAVQHSFLLALLFLASLGWMVFSAIGVADTEDDKVSSLWTLTAVVFALMLLAFYAVVLVTKT